MKYIAVRTFEYPSSLEVRDKIRKGEEVEDRKMTRVVAGAAVIPPDDLLKSWVQRGLINDATQK